MTLCPGEGGVCAAHPKQTIKSKAKALRFSAADRNSAGRLWLPGPDGTWRKLIGRMPHNLTFDQINDFLGDVGRVVGDALQVP